MATPMTTGAYVRGEEAPRLPPPPSTVGIQGWLLKNLFSSLGNSIVTILFGSAVLWLVWWMVDFAILQAVWTGENRDACTGANIGACWPMVASIR